MSSASKQERFIRSVAAKKGLTEKVEAPVEVKKTKADRLYGGK